ncbi:hypothetical protein EVAR_11835_1 [Eumeta japonica]|uniref:Uncharacterized protein n=1 Tax=Eumeta variegata TaxID=151549 RepID=A0A4C1YKT0_EUMVA|nr:hypothetical protein EVAR_11835_1 [Eumeta japonica]
MFEHFGLENSTKFQEKPENAKLPVSSSDLENPSWTKCILRQPGKAQTGQEFYLPAPLSNPLKLTIVCDTAHQRYVANPDARPVMCFAHQRVVPDLSKIQHVYSARTSISTTPPRRVGLSRRASPEGRLLRETKMLTMALSRFTLADSRCLIYERSKERPRYNIYERPLRNGIVTGKRGG